MRDGLAIVGRAVSYEPVERLDDALDHARQLVERCQNRFILKGQPTLEGYLKGRYKLLTDFDVIRGIVALKPLE